MTTDNSGEQEYSTATAVVHGVSGRESYPFGAVVPPVYHSSSFAFESFAEMRAYARGERPSAYYYSRYANPTVNEAESRIAALENAEDAILFPSGSAATFATAMAVCSAGDDLICCDSVYGGTARILGPEIAGKFSIGTQSLGINEIGRIPEMAGPRTRLVWFESPANPINRIVDLEKAADICRAAGIKSIVDNTFATPVLQRPLEHGIDLVMHSATKYLGGHSDLTAGAICGPRELLKQIRKLSITIGLTVDPETAYLLIRGLKTLELRVKAASENALRLAESLVSHPRVAKVYYPGLESSPGHDIARRQMKAFGAVVAFDIRGAEREAERFFDNLKLVRNAASLGGVESLVSYPLYSSHIGFTESELAAAGVSSSTIRISIGIESADDIIADVDRALAAM